MLEIRATLPRADQRPSSQVGIRGNASLTLMLTRCVEIGERFGPLDLALVPIWRGGSLGFVAAMGLRVVAVGSSIPFSTPRILILTRTPP